MIRTIDDYKMVLHNSAIVINDCEATDFPTLTNKFQVYNPIIHQTYPLGIHYDKENRRIFLPRGIDVDYVKRKVESTMEYGFSSTIVHNHPYDMIRRNISIKLPPRDDVQIEALKFCLCEGKYKQNINRSQFCISLPTGKGKTYIASCVFAYLGIKSIVITAQSGILDQWRDRLKEATSIQDSDILKIEGSSMITRILAGKSKATNKSFFLCTHSTLHSYASKYGWDKIGDLFRILGIGIKFFDEAHQNFQNVALIDFATRDVYRTYYITATLNRSAPQENTIYQLYMKNIPVIDLFNPTIDAHTKYIAITFNSYPKPSDIAQIKTTAYGISNPKYIDYLMNNSRFWVMFDYIFGTIYRNGGKALFFIGTNAGIKRVYERIVYNYPELKNDIGIYTSISEDKQLAKSKRFILSTTKSAGAGEDIRGLKYAVVVAEPFKSQIIARQTLGRLRDNNTTYIELVDTGFRQLQSYFFAKKPIFNKYAVSTNVMKVDNPKLSEILEYNKEELLNRFKYGISFTDDRYIHGIEFIDNNVIPGVLFADPDIN